VLRVMTWNLWWRFGPWWPRQRAIGEVIVAEGADVIGLQEVWVEEDGANQADVLARKVGYHHAVGPLRFRDGVAMTNAVLSRWPIRRRICRPLPGPDGQPSFRSVLAAEIDAPVGRLLFVTTHLDWAFDASATRVAQARAVAELVAECRNDPGSGYPAVLTGDLNAVPHADEIRGLTGATAPLAGGLVFTDAWSVAGGSDPGNTWDGDNPHLAGATWPNRRLDYVMVSWPRPKPSGTVAGVHLAGREPIGGVVPSDHYAVVADLVT
jgi:endonuclease/exonuclease/phosphatase family metal-dependent hydrolase